MFHDKGRFVIHPLAQFLTLWHNADFGIWKSGKPKSLSSYFKATRCPPAGPMYVSSWNSQWHRHFS
jgi:hypothetical protein